MGIACVPFMSLFDEADQRLARLEAIQALAEVEVLFGRDTATQDVFLIYGRERLDQIANDVDSGPIDVLVVELERQSSELDRVMALVHSAKYVCDYVIGRPL